MWPAGLFTLGFFFKQDSFTNLYEIYECFSTFCHTLKKTLLSLTDLILFIHYWKSVHPPNQFEMVYFGPLDQRISLSYLNDIFIPIGSSMSARISFILFFLYREMQSYQPQCFWTILTMKFWQSLIGECNWMLRNFHSSFGWITNRFTMVILSSMIKTWHKKVMIWGFFRGGGACLRSWGGFFWRGVVFVRCFVFIDLIYWNEYELSVLRSQQQE